MIFGRRGTGKTFLLRRYYEQANIPVKDKSAGIPIALYETSITSEPSLLARPRQNEQRALGAMYLLVEAVKHQLVRRAEAGPAAIGLRKRKTRSGLTSEVSQRLDEALKQLLSDARLRGLVTPRARAAGHRPRGPVGRPARPRSSRCHQIRPAGRQGSQNSADPEPIRQPQVSQLIKPVPRHRGLAISAPGSPRRHVCWAPRILCFCSTTGPR